jgi:hypothetical protein
LGEGGDKASYSQLLLLFPETISNKMRMMQLDGQPLPLSEIGAVALGDIPIEVAPLVHGRIQDARKVVEGIVGRGGLRCQHRF